MQVINIKYIYIYIIVKFQYFLLFSIYNTNNKI